MILKPPLIIPEEPYVPMVFLAGSIEQGKAVDWQAELGAQLDKQGCIVLNPRRDDWDATWEQSRDNPQFYEQVMWELMGLDLADVVAMYFQPGTQSPISLLELGLIASGWKAMVCCPEGFWRKGNVDIVCEMMEIPLFNDIDKWKQAIFDRVDFLWECHNANNV
jgi:hypothetical protein